MDDSMCALQGLGLGPPSFWVVGSLFSWQSWENKHEWYKQIVVFLICHSSKERNATIECWASTSVSPLANAVVLFASKQAWGEINLADFTMLADDRLRFSIGPFSRWPITLHTVQSAYYFAKFKPGELLSRGPKPVRTHLGCAHSNLTPNLIGFLIWENSIEHNISQSNSQACVITLRLQYHNKIIPPQHCVY